MEENKLNNIQGYKLRKAPLDVKALHKYLSTLHMIDAFKYMRTHHSHSGVSLELRKEEMKVLTDNGFCNGRK